MENKQGHPNLLSSLAVSSGRGGDDGEVAVCCSYDDERHIQDLQGRPLPDQARGRADVGLRQRPGRLPQQIPARDAAHQGEVWPVLRGA